jgi:hypothetical protein
MKNTYVSFSMLVRQWLAQFFFMALVLPSAQVMAHETKHQEQGDAHQITLLMKAQFDRPDAPLKVHPVVVDGNFAVAGWFQGPKGGRALLVKADGKWTISVCGGDGLRDAKVLAQTGMGEAAAQSLAAKVQTAEAKLSKSQLKQLALFQGELKIEPNTAHGDGHGQGHHKPAQHDQH